ncbi:MAG: hypothetical protein HY773_02780 [Candidatus Terrybacteria bacterium]|nr:hypothetical protein [Candidatus Terrybacteria bacterium]
MKIHIKSLGWSTMGTIGLITVMTIWGELSKPFKDFLVGITGHHWTAKGVFSLVFFILVYFIFSKLSDDSLDIKRETYYVVGTAILGGLAIFIFYLWHFFA